MKTLKFSKTNFIICIFFFLISIHKSYSQAGEINQDLGLPDYHKSFSSDKNTNNNVNYSTGQLTSSVHIADLPANGYSVGVNLVYSGGIGIRVNDIASNVGLGWNIVAGGKITRTVRGIRDEKLNGATDCLGDLAGETGWLDPIAMSIGAGPKKVSEAVEYYSASTEPAGVTHANWLTARRTYFHRVKTHIWDSEPDIFDFEFCGYSGSFVFNSDGYPVLIPYQDIKIEPAIGPHAVTYMGAPAWIFTMPDGTKFIFGGYELTSLSVEETYTQTKICNNCPDTKNREYVSGGFLTKIITNKGAEINYVYDDWSITRKEYLSHVVMGWADGAQPFGTCLNGIDVSTKVSRQWYGLSEINSAFGKIMFVESTQNRYDLPYTSTSTPAQQAIQYIRQYNSSNVLIKEFEFIYDYFIFTGPPANAEMANTWDRLRLKELKQNPINATVNPLTYKFEYEPITYYPGITQHNQDFWGFYNNNTQSGSWCSSSPLNNSSLIPYITYVNVPGGQDLFNLSGYARTPDEARTKQGVLKKIIYPSGGSSSFEYENHVTKPSNATVGGLRIKSITGYDGITHDKDLRTEFKYVIDFDSPLSSGKMSPMRRFYDVEKYFNSNGSQNSQYVFRSAWPYRDSPKDYIRYTRVEVWQRNAASTNNNGVTVYEMTGFEDQPDLPAEKFTYEHKEPFPGTQITGLWNPYNTADLDQNGDKDNDAGAPNTDMSFQRGLTKKITIYQRVPEPGDIDPYARSAPDFKLVEFDFTYEYNPSNFTPQELRACKVNSDYHFTSVSASNDIENFRSFNVEYYKQVSKWVYLKSMTKKTYIDDVSNPGNYIETRKDLFYENASHLQPTRIETVNSDNIKTIIIHKYPQDLINPTTSLTPYYMAQALLTLCNVKHIHNTPIVTHVFKEDVGNPCTCILYESKFSMLQQLANGQVVTAGEYVMETSCPFNVTSVNFNFPHCAYSSTDVSFNYDFRYKLKTAHTYDANGYTINSTPTDGITYSTMYNSNYNYPIAEFANAKYSNTPVGNECSFLGFESNTNTDQWGLYSLPSSNDAHTGLNSRQQSAGMTFGPTKDFLPSNQYNKYKFSCWVKTEAGYTANNGKLILHTKPNNNNDNYQFPVMSGSWVETDFGDTYGQWKYVEAIIDLGAIRATVSSDLRIRCFTVNDDAGHYFLIDDIRFQPVDATVKTYTHNDRFQISSVSDERSIPVFYEYDGFGNLTLTKDLNQKILSETVSHSADLADNHNYIRNRVPNYPVTTQTALDGLATSYKQVTFNYYDGLGRPIQTVIQKFTDNINGKDFVQPIAYDEFGRQAISYLPYAGGNDGSFKPNAIADQANFYQTATEVAHNAYPYSETVFEPSPLNRVLKQGAPGEDWQPAQNHTTRTYYLTNAANEVQIWEMNGNADGASSTGFYGANTLNKTEVKDENGNSGWEYTDKSGKLICRKLKVISEDNALTGPQTYDFPPYATTSVVYYYSYVVYDPFGRIKYEIPAKAYHDVSQSGFAFMETDPVFDKYIYGYRYDEKGRLIEKKIPGQVGWNQFIYNKRGHMIMSQSPVQRVGNLNDWTFVKYDALGRTVITGIAHLPENNGQMYVPFPPYYIPLPYIRMIIQQDVDAQWPAYFCEKRSSATGNIMGYTNTAWPIIAANDEVLTVFYYDDYNFNTESRTFQTVFPGITPTQLTTGLMTGSLVKVLGTSNYLLTVNYYDEKTRMIQQHKEQLEYTWDVISNLYDFTGNLLVSKRTYTTGNSVLNIRTRYVYDHSGRRRNSYLQVNNEPEIAMSNKVYNEANQVIQKNLHYDPLQSSYLQNIDYRYNIRGWLTKINNAACDNDGIDNLQDNDVFGEELFYNDINDVAISIATPTPQYNGNIAAMKWKAKGPDDDPYIKNQNLYVYKYDDLNRMTAAYYASGQNSVPNQTVLFNENENWYNEELTYDMAGNILQLKRNAGDMDLISGYTAIDDLVYDYDGTGNKLKNVADNQTTQYQTGFIDGNTSGNDYAYNADGNLVTDLNKGLNITYNYLNLAQTVTKTDGSESITTTYDANGRKLKQVASGTINQTQIYVDGLEYEGDLTRLKLILTEEGRVRPIYNDEISNPVIYNYFYDYFIKDHLGSVRAVITHDVNQSDYYATMETQNASFEEQLFYNIPNTRGNAPPEYPPDYTYSPNFKVSALNAAQGRPIGHAKVLRVIRGDNIDIDTKYYFENSVTSLSSPRPVSDILSQLSNIFFLNPSNGTSIAGGETSVRQRWSSSTFTGNSSVSNFLSDALSTSSTTNPATPQAYLVWLFYKDNFEFVPAFSGVQQATEEDVLGELAVLDLVAPDNGYFYVYVTNESPVDVSFDNLRIMHASSILLEINDYYPYGLYNPALSVRPSLETMNSYKFQNKELFLSVNGIEDFGWRQYDPVLGRWSVQDPALQFANPYLAMGNNPVVFVDPDGRFLHIIIGAVLGGLINLAVKAIQGDIHNFRDGLVAFGIGAVAGAVGAATGGAAFLAAGGAAAGAGGFIAGAMGGMVGAAYGAPIQNMGNHLYFGDPLMTPEEYAISIAAGGILGGATNGIMAVANGRNFWTGRFGDIKLAPTLPGPTSVQSSTPPEEPQLKVPQPQGDPLPEQAPIPQNRTGPDGIKFTNDIVTFGKNANQAYHTFRHVIAEGLDPSAVQRAVQADIIHSSSMISTGVPFNSTIYVQGTNVTYTAFRLPNGVINVGRITVP